MKRVFVFTVGLISLVCLVCYSNVNKHVFYGIHTFKEVTYLSPLSPSAIDYTNEQMSETKYTIKADLFKIASKDNIVESSSPKYSTNLNHKKIISINLN